jgi:hypothetical protein
VAHAVVDTQGTGPVRNVGSGARTREGEVFRLILIFRWTRCRRAGLEMGFMCEGAFRHGWVQACLRLRAWVTINERLGVPIGLERRVFARRSRSVSLGLWTPLVGSVAVSDRRTLR